MTLNPAVAAVTDRAPTSVAAGVAVTAAVSGGRIVEAFTA